MVQQTAVTRIISLTVSHVGIKILEIISVILFMLLWLKGLTFSALSHCYLFKERETAEHPEL